MRPNEKNQYFQTSTLNGHFFFLLWVKFSGMVICAPKVYKDSGRIRIKHYGCNEIPPHADSITASLAALMCSGDQGKQCCDYATCA